MIKNIYTSDQTSPYLFFTRLLKSKDVKNRLYKYLDCLKNNKISRKDISSILKKLKEEGCSYAFFANSLVESFLISNNYQYDDNKFIDLYGLSIQVDNDSIDSSIMMVDIFSKLFNLSRFNIHKYDVRIFKNAKEAALGILGVDIENDTDAILELFNNGYVMDGSTLDGNIRFKSKNVINITMVGTYDDIANKLFGVSVSNISKQELTEMLKKKDITFDEVDKDPHSKLSGLTSSNMNFWGNYYLNLINSNLECNFNVFHMDEVDNFEDYIRNALASNNIVGVSTSAGSDVKMIDPRTNESISIASDSAGHMMTFRKFDIDGNIIVDSYGKDYLIKKDDLNSLLFNVVNIKNKSIDNIKEEQKKI